jgi:tetratricopeptide (TPR) repeat protein
LAKIKALPAQPDNGNLAQYYLQHSDLDQAAAIYKKQMEEAAADPQQMLSPAQSLASVYEQQKRPDDAAAVLQEAATALDSLGKPELAAESAILHQRLATLLYQNGHTEAADQAFPPPPDNGTAASHFTTVSYANYLGATKRAAQGETLLADYLAAHPALNANEQGNMLMSLANLAGYAGDSKRAEEYSQEARQKFQPKDPPAEVVLIQPTLQKAQAAATIGNTAEAIALATEAIAQSATARDRDALARMAPSLASAIGIKAAVQADELFRNIAELTQSWSADTMSPWLAALESYPRFLMSQQRAGEVPPAIARYQAALKTARGPDSGWLEDPLRLTIDMERGRNSPQAAVPAAQNLLALEESLDGPISEPGYRAAETLADLYRSTNDSTRALPLYQQTITIADSIFRADDRRRIQPRMNAAMVLIAERRLDEAEQVVLEGMALPVATPPGSTGFAPLLKQIQALRQVR